MNAIDFPDPVMEPQEPEPPAEMPDPVVEPADPVLVPELVTDEPKADEPPEQALARQSTDLQVRANALTVTDEKSFLRAGEFIQALKDKVRQIEEFFQDDIDRAHATHAGLTSKRKRLVDPLKEAMTLVSTRYSTFSREQKAAAEAERRRLEREAQEQERARLQAEAAAREAEARALEEQAMSAPSREEGLALEEQAVAVQAEVEQLRVEAVMVQAPVIQVRSVAETPKGAPTVGAKWTFEVTDKLKLLRAVLEGKVSTEAIVVNDTYLRGRAKADKDTANIPGVRIYDAGSVTSARRR